MHVVEVATRVVMNVHQIPRSRFLEVAFPYIVIIDGHQLTCEVSFGGANMALITSIEILSGIDVAGHGCPCGYWVDSLGHGGVDVAFKYLDQGMEVALRWQ